MKKLKDEYQSKVIEDNGLTRSRVPTPVLNRMGARPGDSMTFRLVRSGEAVMRVSRARAKTGIKGGRKTTKGKRRQ